jgi:hypothetical protein
MIGELFTLDLFDWFYFNEFQALHSVQGFFDTGHLYVSKANTAFLPRSL